MKDREYVKEGGWVQKCLSQAAEPVKWRKNLHNKSLQPYWQSMQVWN